MIIDNSSLTYCGTSLEHISSEGIYWIQIPDVDNPWCRDPQHCWCEYRWVSCCCQASAGVAPELWPRWMFYQFHTDQWLILEAGGDWEERWLLVQLLFVWCWVSSPETWDWSRQDTRECPEHWNIFRCCWSNIFVSSKYFLPCNIWVDQGELRQHVKGIMHFWQ